MKAVEMPKMGDTMEEGKILRWLKHEGDLVKQDEPLAEVETDKVNIEMEAGISGVVRRILIGEGEAVPIGTVIALIGEADEPLPDSNALFPSPTEPAVPLPPERNQRSKSQGVPPGLQKGSLLFCLLTLLLTLGVSFVKALWPLSIFAGIAVVLLVWLLTPAVRH